MWTQDFICIAINVENLRTHDRGGQLINQGDLRTSDVTSQSNQARKSKDTQRSSNIERTHEEKT